MSFGKPLTQTRVQDPTKYAGRNSSKDNFIYVPKQSEKTQKSGASVIEKGRDGNKK